MARFLAVYTMKPEDVAAFRARPRSEQEAIGHWERLSTWRKTLAVGGFAVGTFGLGFTLGGLVFGRWRKA